MDQILPVLEEVFRIFSIDFYILGGLARDIHFLSEGLTPRRITRDIDVAAFVPDPSSYSHIMQRLIKERDFEKVTGNPVRLRHITGVVVDILPFNEMTSADLEMTRFGPAFIDFNLKGFYEVFEQGLTEISINSDHRYKVTTPEAIIFLKFFAYEDKPDWRLKDLEDIGQLLRYYFDLNETDIYLHHNDLFGEERELETISARVLGRKLKPVLAPNEFLKRSFQSILARYIEAPHSMPVLALSRYMDKPPEDVVRYMKEIITGLNEKLDEV